METTPEATLQPDKLVICALAPLLDAAAAVLAAARRAAADALVEHERQTALAEEKLRACMAILGSLAAHGADPAEVAMVTKNIQGEYGPYYPFFMSSGIRLSLTSGVGWRARQAAEEAAGSLSEDAGSKP